MQIELLDTFLDLITTRSFHRTAERLRVTQSTVSARVQTLEASVGGRLFTRSRAGTDLTTEGLKFEVHARALRHAWTEAQRAVAPSGTVAISLRIGIQNDLAAAQISSWVAKFLNALPDCAFYIEPDYSTQMCHDVDRGAMDFAVIYTPVMLPDLYLESVGSVRYRLISSEGARRSDLTLPRYIRGAFSAAFDQAHGQSLPEFGTAQLASGQNIAVAGLLTGMGGAGFVLEDTARTMIAGGGFQAVTDVAPISQPIYAVMHQRHRTSRMHRRLTRIVAREIAGVVAE